MNNKLAADLNRFILAYQHGGSVRKPVRYQQGDTTTFLNWCPSVAAVRPRYTGTGSPSVVMAKLVHKPLVMNIREIKKYACF